MAQDVTVILENRPGTLADVGETLGKSGINIDGLCGIPCEGKGVLHLLVENGAAARSVLEAAGFTVMGPEDVLVLPIDDRPGSFGQMTRKIADAGINVDLVYVASQTRVVIAADDLEKVQAVL